MLSLITPFLPVFAAYVLPLILMVTFLPAFKYLLLVFKVALITLDFALALKVYFVLAGLIAVFFLVIVTLAAAVEPL